MGAALPLLFIQGNMRLDLCSWPVTARHRVETNVTSCEVCGARSGTGTGLSSQFFDFPQPFFIPLLRHRHSVLSAELCDSLNEAEHYYILHRKVRGLISRRKMVVYCTFSWTAIIWLIKLSHKSKQRGHVYTSHLKTNFCTESDLLVLCQDIYLHVHSPGVIRWQPEIVWRGATEGS